jgi:hypothetical protein
MTRMLMILTASAMALSPSMTVGKPGGGGMGQGATMGQGGRMGHAGGMGISQGTIRSEPTTTQSGMGSANGKGWNHSNSPKHETGQAFFECEESRPGHASSAPGSAFNPDGNAGTHYAGEQPQNSRNTSSVSQYDTACMHQPQH